MTHPSREEAIQAMLGMTELARKVSDMIALHLEDDKIELNPETRYLLQAGYMAIDSLIGVANVSFENALEGEDLYKDLVKKVNKAIDEASE